MIKITHLRTETLEKKPNQLSRVYFFTENGGEIYWGTDTTNPIDKENIKNWSEQGTVVELREPIFIEKEEGLFAGGEDQEVFIVNTRDSIQKKCGNYSDLILKPSEPSSNKSPFE